MSTDLTKLSSDQVLDLINTDNNSELTFEHISFAIPESLTDDIDGKNTSLLVQSRPNGGYVGDVSVKYNRLDMEGFGQYGPAILEIPDGGGLPEIVSAFNDFYDANLTLGEDVDDEIELPEIDYVDQTFTLPARGASLAYRGSMDVTVRFASTLLSEAIAQINLRGLSYPLVQGEPLDGTVRYLGSHGGVVSRHGLIIDEGILARFGGYKSNQSQVFYKFYDLINDQGVVDGSTFSTVFERTYPAKVGNILYYLTGNYLRTYDIVNNVDTGIGLTDLGVSNDGSFVFYINTILYLIASKGCRIYNLETQAFSDMSHHVDTQELRCFSAAELDGKIYIGGGYTSNTVTNYFKMYDPETNKWTDLPPIPTALHSATMTSVNGFLYVFGGSTHMGYTPTKTLHRYDPNTMSWFTYPEIIDGWNGSGVIQEHAAIAFEGKLYIHGGQNTGNGNSRTADLYEIS